MTLSLKIYHRLPTLSRSAVASLRGYYLKWWRYDKFTDHLVERVLERDSWSSEQWADWQAERLGFLLERAATKVPYYRHLWADRRRRGDKASWSYLENWPVLEKESLRLSPESFVAEDCRQSRMFHESTSGTTGTSLDLWLSHETVKHWYAMFEARWRRWYGISRHDRWAILGGQLVTPVTQRKPPFWVWNSGLNQLYMSSYHLSPSLIDHYIDALARFRVTYIWAYPSSVYCLAKAILKAGRRDLAIKVVITNAEPLYDHQREMIAEAFNCPVRETYGMAEMVAAASECSEGQLHQWPDAGIIESGPNRNDHEIRDLICTGLVNADMPLIRYRVGDAGVLSHTKCVCGVNLPRLGKIEGRNDDILYTEDGRQIGRLDPIFKGNLPIVETQVIQESLSSFRIIYVPAENFDSSSLGIIAHRLRERLGDVSLAFESVSEVPRTNNGKFRAVVCKLTARDLRPIKNRVIEP